MTSVSVVAWNTPPSRSKARRSSPALTRFPLCATAICPPMYRAKKGCAFSMRLAPVVD